MPGRRTQIRFLGSGVIGTFFAFFLIAANVAAASPQFGYKDQSYAGAAEAPSGSKPESKLWYNDGIWWGDMWDTRSPAGFDIWRLNAGGSTWTDTGVANDSRPNTRGDALWDGSKLYIASHVSATDSSHNTAGQPAYLYRYSYDSGSKTYTPDAGFPVTITSVATETLVIDKDSTGTIWATWTQGKAVKVAHTVGNDLTWSAPITPAITGDTAMTSDDISSLIAFGGNKIGLMWSNQSSDHMYFSTHTDGAPDTSWSATEAATTGNNSADDHINLKTDSAGRIYAAVKTSLTSSSSTLTQLLVRSAGGTWSASRFGTVADSNTRPIVLVDEANGVVHMFATGKYPGNTSGQSGGTIYEKTAPINNIVFPTGNGTPFIQDPNSKDMNNASSTKQNVTAASGIVVIATNDSTSFYWHDTEALGPSAPVAAFHGTPTTGASPLNVQFTDDSTGTPTTWSWDFGDSSTSTQQNPSHQYASDGSYTVKLTVTNGAGQDSITKSNYIVVGTKPTADFTADQTTGSAPLAVQFTDASTGNPTSWSWDFGDSTTSTAQNPSHTYQSDGTYTVKLTATNATGSDTKTKTGYIIVGTPPVASFTADQTNGAAPLTVNFTDTSTNSPTSWSWDFGDPGSGNANTSTLQNPAHTYNAGGTYTVKLTATNAAGSDTATQTGYITVTSNQTTLTFNPVADSYVSSSNLTGNYGTATTAKVREGDGSSTNPNYRTYLKFNLTGVSGTVGPVKLRLFVTDASANVESVSVASDNSWGETTINYNNAPTFGSAVGSISKPALGWIEITLDPSIVGPNPQTLTLVLKSSATDSLIVSTREDPTNKPQLVVTFQ